MSKSSRASQSAERRARVEELRRQQRAQERRRTLIAAGIVGVGVLIVVVVLAFALSRSGGGSSGNVAGLDVADQIIPSAPSGTNVTNEQLPKSVPNKTGIKGVLAFDTQGWPGDGKPHPGALEHAHVDGPVEYAVIPPVGGPHNPVWMNAGVYTKPIPAERAVHNLEHGAIWIVYKPDLPAAEVKKLVAFVGRQTMIPESDPNSPGQANRFMDLSPWTNDDLPSPIVMSAWGYQLRFSSPADPRMQQFVNMFRHNPKYTPEYGAEVDGIPVDTGGRPAGYGSKNPNPPGSAQ